MNKTRFRSSTLSAHTLLILALATFTPATGNAQPVDTLPELEGPTAPHDFQQMWRGFDPRTEPLETELLREWEEDGVVLRIVRFRIGVFKGQKSVLAAIYGFPRDLVSSKNRLPGLVQIHGGGQYADYKACLANAKRGYATLSIAWAGRISAPKYQVSPKEVQLFWDGRTEDPAYRLTTDWGAVDGYHAPGRNSGNSFPSAAAAEWTLDDVESPRNSGWFLCALAARRALTFLERQPEVDPERLGVYGHSMGGKLTIMASVDSRVKAAAPSCGGISDRYNRSKLFCSTIGDDVSLREVKCPVMFLSPANDFHGRLGDLPSAINEIQSDNWRVTCSPHHNHQDNDEYEVATMLWFDQHLKSGMVLPGTPTTETNLKGEHGSPVMFVRPDASRQVLSVDVFYTQQGQLNAGPEQHKATIHRFWHHATTEKSGDLWMAELPLGDADKPLWAYANVRYRLDESVAGVGYYYGEYDTDTFVLSSQLETFTAKEVSAAKPELPLKPSLTIEDFRGDWRKEWFTYRLEDWPLATNKLNSHLWKAPAGASLAIEVKTKVDNKLVVMIDEYAAVADLSGSDDWQTVTFDCNAFQNASEDSLVSWKDVRYLKLSAKETLRSGRGDKRITRRVGAPWNGPSPEFRRLRWQPFGQAIVRPPKTRQEPEWQLASAKVRQPSRPNIVFIFADDWGWGDLSCHGHPYIKTPNIDRLAKEGTDFHRFTVASGVCSPSRTAVMTGHFPARYNIDGHFAWVPSNAKRNMPDWLSPASPTLPRFLQAAGYATAHFGKWHLSNNMIPDSPLPSEYGYDEYGAFNCAGEQMPVHEDADHAISFMESSVKAGKPFFINLWMHEPHTPFHTVPKYRWRFQELDEPDNIYASVLSHADDRIGEVLDALDRLKVTDETLVVFSSDNGPARSAGNAELTLMHDTATGAGFNIAASRGITGGRKGYKSALFEGGICVPFIARWPGKIAAGQVDDSSMLSAVDLLPTFCELAGATLPNDYQPDGVSQVKALMGDASASREKPLFWKMQSGWPIRKSRPHHWVSYAVVSGTWKLMTNRDGTYHELYNIASDPYEKRNLSDSEAGTAERLSRQINDWKATLPPRPTGNVFSAERSAAKEPAP